MSMFVGTKRRNQRLSCRRKTCGLFSCVWVRATKLKKGWTSSSSSSSSSSSFILFFFLFLWLGVQVGGSGCGCGRWWQWMLTVAVGLLVVKEMKMRIKKIL